MNVDGMFAALNGAGVDYLLIGGMNFLLRHEPVLTFDVDVWIEDSPANRARCAVALRALNATWGRTEEEWGPVSRFGDDWLSGQGVFCMVTSAGPLDVFRSVAGLASWAESAARAVPARTPAGTAYRGLSDTDMLACQLALDESSRKLDRVRLLKRVIGS